MTLRDQKSCDDCLYVDYMSSEDSEYEEVEDPITGDRNQQLVGYVTKKLPWQRTALTNLKVRLDRAHRENLNRHAKQLLKPRRVGGASDRPAPDGPSWAVRQPQTTSEWVLYEDRGWWGTHSHGNFEIMSDNYAKLRKVLYDFSTTKKTQVSSPTYMMYMTCLYQSFL